MTDDRREGRGRLSSIDLLPEDAEADIIWALEELRARKRPQSVIRAEFNARLADRGIDEEISRSGFSRWSVRKAIQFRRLDEVRAITGDVVAGLGPDGADDVTVTIAEILKAAIYESLEVQRDPKSILELARSLSAVVTAQKSSTEHRAKLEARINATVEKAADTAVIAASEAGLSAERVAQIRRDVLGVRQ